MKPLLGGGDSCVQLIGKSGHARFIVLQLPEGSGRYRKDGENIVRIHVRLLRVTKSALSQRKVVTKALHDASVACLDSSMSDPITNVVHLFGDLRLSNTVLFDMFVGIHKSLCSSVPLCFQSSHMRVAFV